MIKWLITIVVVYFVYRWIQGKPLLPSGDRKSIDDPPAKELDYTDYEEIDEDGR